MKLSFYDYARIGHIKRWHNVNTVRQQTVAEHCFMVVVIAMELQSQLGGEVDWGRMITAAIFHDMPEVAGGDTPTPAKRLLVEITGDSDLFHKLDKALMPELPYLGGKVPLVVERIIEMADSIEAAHWIRDNGAGYHAEVVKAGCRRRMEDRVEKFHIVEPDRGWYPAVNHVLMHLGMPFVHRESRLSPP